MKYSLALAILAVLVLSTSANANITSVDCYNDGDGAIIMNYWDSDLSDSANGIVSMDEALHWYPAHALVDVTTDELDPTLRITKEVDNDTTYAWSGYLINVVRNGYFTIPSATEPIGWNPPAITTPTLQVSGIYAGLYEGSVSYAAGAGTPVAIGNTGVFKLTTSFSGSSTFTLEQIPIPEPSTLALLLLGGLGGLAIFKRR
ncbi:MAG: PEP-CTERM sorting domain-containing protein [Thermoguttaceae bacterium]|jgi:hypothetical protein